MDMPNTDGGELTNQTERLKLSKNISQWLLGQGFTKLTDVQMSLFPPAVSGQDVIGIAPTGTGKTLAFLLPICHLLLRQQGTGVRALILAPTRELATQIHSVAVELCAELHIQTTLVYGGTGMMAQRKAVKTDPGIVIGTPGRVWDLYLEGSLVLTGLKYLVLDEADRLMDMGFMPQLRRMLEVVPRRRQFYLLSATFNDRVERLSEEFLEHPIKVEVQREATLPPTITENFLYAPNMATKLRLLADEVADDALALIFIFVKKRQTAGQVAEALRKQGHKPGLVHADKSQTNRIATMEAVKAGALRIIVATDLAARGLDVEGVDIVVNLELPADLRDYVHRVGRSGRAGQPGRALTLIDPVDELRVEDMEKVVRRRLKVTQPDNAWVVPITPPEELQEQARQIDEIKRRRDPAFKGAFHEKTSWLGPPRKKTSANSASPRARTSRDGAKAKPPGRGRR